ncbi:MAG TPA: AsmA-like C-terminal region-containing protein [Chthoniobacterales bacterium]|nr:AsmA-like C-terminal region-containing protein [Chthoniobacterales bacterium]
MRRLVLFGFGAIVALAAALLIALNLYVQSEGAQAWIEAELSERVGTALHIRGTGVTPWGGLTLSGITIPQRSTLTGVDFLQAKSFHLHLRLLPLFSHRLVITSIALIDPTVVWPQNAEGKWRLPSAAPQPLTPPPAQMPSIASSPAEAVSPTPPQERYVSPAGKPRRMKSALAVEIRRLNISGGNFQFLDRTGLPLATFENLKFSSTLSDAHTLRGSAKVAKISLRNRFFVAGFHSPVRFEQNVLELPKISGQIGSGELNAKFKLDVQSAGSPFSVSANLRNVHADQIVAEAGGAKNLLQGKLDAALEAAGKTADPNALTGHGQISLRDGQLQQYSLLVALGQILQIDELSQLHLDQAWATYHLTPGRVNIDELVLRSPNIRLSATGTLGFDSELRMDSQLAISDQIRGRLFKPLRDNFQPIDEPGYSAIAFNVAGTIDRPSTNLLDRMVGRELKDFVRGLFGSKKSKKKKAPENEPAEVALPTAAPSVPADVTSPAATSTPSP